MTRKHRLAIWFGSIIAALVAFGATYPRWFPGTTNTGATAIIQPALLAASTPSADGDARNWAHLSQAEQEALAPLAGQWDHFTDHRKIKWLKIAARYSRMSVKERERLHDRMKEWIRISPEQRRIARENYLLSKHMAPAQREHAWQAYQKLPEEQKKKLAAAEHKNRRPTVVSAPPSGEPPFNGLHRHVANGKTPATVAGAVSASAAAVPASGGQAAAGGTAPASAAGTPGAPTGASLSAAPPASSASAPSGRVVPLLEPTLH